MKTLALLAVVGFVLAACTSSELASLNTAETTVLDALPVACTIADAIDPAGSTVVCAILDAAGNVLESATKQLESPAIAAALVAKHPSSVVVAAKLKALK